MLAKLKAASHGSAPPNCWLKMPHPSKIGMQVEYALLLDG